MTWVSRTSAQTLRGVRDAGWAADQYFSWLDRSVPGVGIAREGASLELWLPLLRRPAIELRRVSELSERVRYRVRGGALVRSPPSGEFEFKTVGDDVVVELRGFTPRLPRLLYFLTHFVIHELVMAWFCRHLRSRTHAKELH